VHPLGNVNLTTFPFSSGTLNMNFLQIIALPFSLIYGFIGTIRNGLYNVGMFKSKAFKLPVIVVGNLSMGGTGKSPHIEYLVRLLKKDRKLATLSRGYKRSTKGFIEADSASTAATIGDEPLQFHRKFSDLTVAVDADRVNGITTLLQNHPNLNAILLDDAFQHRKVKPGFSILLTEFDAPYSSDFVVPSGRLREFRGGSNRADIIVVTKCPTNLTEAQRHAMLKRLNPKSDQKVYFSFIKYKGLRSVFGNEALPLESLNNDLTIAVFTGIANPKPLLGFLEQQQCKIEHQQFPDHHAYSSADLQSIRKIFDNIAAENALLLTTEKDAVRFMSTATDQDWKNLPFYYIEIEIAFHGSDKAQFDEQVLNYVRTGND
jgi:tetraacyldisaccharide 4'-kinase